MPTIPILWLRGLNRPAVREQRIVRMHDPLGLSGRAGGEGEIDNAIGIARGGKTAGPGTRQAGEPDRLLILRNVGPKRIDAINLLETRQRPEHRKDIVLRSISPVTRLRKKSGRARAREQRDNFLAGVIAMERRIADISHARARHEHEHGFNAAWQPNRDSIAGRNAGVMQLLGYGIDPFQRGTKGQPRVRIAKRKAIGSCLGQCPQQSVKRVGPPVAALVEMARTRDILQGEHRIHRTVSLFAQIVLGIVAATRRLGADETALDIPPH